MHRSINWLATFFSLLIPIISAVQLDEADFSRMNAKNQFPISLPNPIQYKGEGVNMEAFINSDEKNPCLFYMESLSVVVMDYKNKVSYWAEIGTDGKGKFDGSIECPKNFTLGDGKNTFEVNLAVDGAGTVGYSRSDLLNKDNMVKDKVQFEVGAVEVKLIFAITEPFYWELVGANASKIEIKAAGENKIKGINVDNSWTLVGAGERKSNWNIYGFKDYNYACAHTSPITWKKEGKDQAVGISFNHFQFQPTTTKGMAEGDEAKFVKFTRKTNDCEGLFSVGTWMGLIISILLIAVLSFGYLMLNSVQTMDRFDDPKQKMLQINAKE